MKERSLIVLGSGSIAQGFLGVLSTQNIRKWKSIKLVTNETTAREFPEFVEVYTVLLERSAIFRQLEDFVSEGDVVVNVTVSVGTEELIHFCRARGALYIDTSNEAWPGEHKLATAGIYSGLEYIAQNDRAGLRS